MLLFRSSSIQHQLAHEFMYFYSMAELMATLWSAIYRLAFLWKRCLFQRVYYSSSEVMRFTCHFWTCEFHQGAFQIELSFLLVGLAWWPREELGQESTWHTLPYPSILAHFWILIALLIYFGFCFFQICLEIEFRLKCLYCCSFCICSGSLLAHIYTQPLCFYFPVRRHYLALGWNTISHSSCPFSLLADWEFGNPVASPWLSQDSSISIDFWFWSWYYSQLNETSTFSLSFDQVVDLSSRYRIPVSAL